jgi:uncharacterized protein DUF4855
LSLRSYDPSRLVSLVVVLVFLSIAVFPSGAAQTSPQRWVLVYAGGAKRPAYTVDDLVHLLAVVDTGGRPTGWLCDGVLFLEFRAVSGRFYMPSGTTPPSSGADWTTYLDSVFAGAGPMARLDSAAGIVARASGTAGRRASVALMIPYPDGRSDTLRFTGRTYGMKTDSERAEAASAYAREASRRFAALHAQHLSLTAFYWLNEAIADPDTGVVSRIGAEVHKAGAAFLWIPFYTAAGAARWRSLGFDAAWLQPNYFFHPEVPATRLDTAVTRARAAGMGLEVEFDARMFSNWLFADRLEPYLAALEGAPDLRSKPIAIYEGAGALIQLSKSRDSWHRALYERLVADLKQQ